MEILSSNPLPSFMYEVFYCSANLLLIAFSTQLYEKSMSKSDNLFLRYVDNVCRAQMMTAIEHRDRDMSWTMPARLMRALVTHAVDPALATSLPASRGILPSSLRAALRQSGGPIRGRKAIFFCCYYSAC